MAFTVISRQRGGKTTVALKSTVSTPEDKIVGGVFFGFSPAVEVAKKFSRSVTSPFFPKDRRLVSQLMRVEHLGGAEDADSPYSANLCEKINADREDWTRLYKNGGCFDIRIYKCTTESGFTTWVPDVGFTSMEIPTCQNIERQSDSFGSTWRTNREQTSMLARSEDFDELSENSPLDPITDVVPITLAEARSISDTSMAIVVFIGGYACFVNFQIDEEGDLFISKLLYQTAMYVDSDIGFENPSLVALEGLTTPLDAFENPRQGYSYSAGDSVIAETPVATRMRKGITALTEMVSILRFERDVMSDEKHYKESSQISSVINKLNEAISISQSIGPQSTIVEQVLDSARDAIATILYGAATRTSPFGVFDAKNNEELAEMLLQYGIPADKVQTLVLADIAHTMQKIMPSVVPFLYDVDMFKHGLFDLVFDARNTTVDTNKIVDPGVGRVYHITAIERQFGLKGTYFCDSLSMWLYSLRDEKGGAGARGLSKRIPNALAKTTFSNAILLYAVPAEVGENDPFQATPLDHLINSQIETAHENGFMTLPLCGYSRWTNRRVQHPIAIEGEDGAVYVIKLPENNEDASRYIDATGQVVPLVEVEAIRILKESVEFVTVKLRTYMVNASADQYAYVAEIM